jgi:hypothetical protein
METPNTVLITTTINVPHVLSQWATGMRRGDCIIVAGDQKSPYEEIRALLREIDTRYSVKAVYLRPEAQNQWSVSEVIGWNCIQRRNIALLEAIALNPKYILTIDDDNAPTQRNQVERLVQVFENPKNEHDFSKTNTGWYNPGRSCMTMDYRSVTHRGFPLSQRHIRPLITAAEKCEIGVAAMLWTGAPDIDAVERIVSDPEITRIYHDDVVVVPGVWAPFNTQATMFRAELAPAMFMWPHVGRYDDIWASYLTRAVMDELGWGAYYGHPVVHQDRNPHDLIKDLKAEIFGMEHNETIINALRTEYITDQKNDVLAMTQKLFDSVDDTDVLPHNTVRSFQHWLKDVRRAQGDI